MSCPRKVFQSEAYAKRLKIEIQHCTPAYIRGALDKYWQLVEKGASPVSAFRATMKALEQG